MTTDFVKWNSRDKKKDETRSFQVFLDVFSKRPRGEKTFGDSFGPWTPHIDAFIIRFLCFDKIIFCRPVSQLAAQGKAPDARSLWSRARLAWKIRATSTTRATVSASAQRQAIDDKTVAPAEPADSDWSSMGAEVRLDVDSDKRGMETDDNGADSSDKFLLQVNARFTAVRQYFLKSMNKKWVR